MKFNNTPDQMFFTFDPEAHQYKPVGSSEIRGLSEGSTLYKVSYTYSNNDEEQLHLALGCFYKVSDDDRSNPNYTRFSTCNGNTIKYIFSSRQAYSNQNWFDLPHEEIISLSEQDGYGGQFDIGMYDRKTKRLSKACPLQPTPDSKALNDLLNCIDKTREHIEIEKFFAWNLYDDYRIRNNNLIAIDNAWKKTNSAVLRARMLEIVKLRNENNPAYDKCLDKLVRDLDQSDWLANQEQFKRINMQILSCFIAAMGIAAVAVAFAVLVNPVGVGIAAGIGSVATLTAGYLFFNNYTAKPRTFDSYFEQATFRCQDTI